MHAAWDACGFQRHQGLAELAERLMVGSRQSNDRIAPHRSACRVPVIGRSSHLLMMHNNACRSLLPPVGEAERRERLLLPSKRMLSVGTAAWTPKQTCVEEHFSTATKVLNCTAVCVSLQVESATLSVGLGRQAKWSHTLPRAVWPPGVHAHGSTTRHGQLEHTTQPATVCGFDPDLEARCNRGASAWPLAHSVVGQQQPQLCACPFIFTQPHEPTHTHSQMHINSQPTLEWHRKKQRMLAHSKPPRHCVLGR